MPIARRASSAPASDEGLTNEDEVTTTRSSSNSRRGWGAAKSTLAKTKSTGEFAAEWRFQKDPTLIKFLEDEPFFAVGQHWIEEKTEGKRGYYCLADEAPEGCPLCAVGHRARPLVFFNIVPLTGEEAFTIKALQAGPQLTRQLEEENDSKGGPLSKHYWNVRMSKSGTGRQGKVTYHMSSVKARDVAEDWEMDPADAQARINTVTAYSEDIFKFSTVEDLEEIRDEFLI